MSSATASGIRHAAAPQGEAKSVGRKQSAVPAPGAWSTFAPASSADLLSKVCGFSSFWGIASQQGSLLLAMMLQTVVV